MTTIFHNQKPQILYMWDLGEQPDMQVIAANLGFIYGFVTCPKMLVIDTGEDEYAVVLGDYLMTPDEADEFYRNWFEYECDISYFAVNHKHVTHITR